MRSTDQRVLEVSMPEMEWFNGEWRIKDPELRGRIHALLVSAYAGADPSFDRDRLQWYPTRDTVVFVGSIAGEPVATTALKKAVDAKQLDELLETDVPELERAMVGHALDVLLDTRLADVEAAMRRLEAIVDRRALVRLIEAREDRLEGLGARLQYPIAVSARAGNVKEFRGQAIRGLNKFMRFRMLEYAWLAGFQGQAGLNAEPGGLPARLEKLGYWTFPVQQARWIFPGAQRVSWLPRSQFRPMIRQLHKVPEHSQIRGTCWDQAARTALDLMGGEPW